MFKRKIYNKLLEWKKREGETALLIEGARRVGKTTLVKEFAQNEYKSYALIDFHNTSKNILSLFDDYWDIDLFFLKLQQELNVELYERNSCIVFDEVQLCPKARQAIKTLVEDGRYDYIETGSLISIHQNVKDILIPSEEQRIKLYPLDYEEFLLATGKDTSFKYTLDIAKKYKKIGEKAVRTELERFRLYMLIGGMPQAIKTYLSTNNLARVDQVKREILNLYQQDFRKIDKTGNLTRLFNAIPAQLNSNAKRYQTNAVIKDTNKDKQLSYIAELQDSQTVLVSAMVNDPNIGLSNMTNLNNYKLYLADTGLFVTLMFWDSDYTDNVVYNQLLHNKLSANLGYLYENIVAQMLTAKGGKLFYWTQFNTSTRRNYEVDFVLSRKNKICPIEVKSSSYKTHKSLDVFSQKYRERILNKYVVIPKDISYDNDVTYIPPFLIPYI